MRISKLLFFFLLICGFSVHSQIKIGDNPQNIDASSILELESTTRAFVINRVTTAQMNAIVPIEGAMVYNTDIQCLHYYDGQNWLNMCEALGLTITNNPVIHADTTIAITRVDNNINIEVKSITGLQIVDKSIRREDIANAAIGGALIQDASITLDKISPGPPNRILKTDPTGLPIWAIPSPSPIAFGKVNGNSPLKIFGVTGTTISVGGSTNSPSINFVPPRPDRDYSIQLTVFGDNRIILINQNQNAFQVQLLDASGDPVVSAIEWYFTVFDN